MWPTGRHTRRSDGGHPWDHKRAFSGGTGFFVPYTINRRRYLFVWEIAQEYDCATQTVRNYIHRNILQGVMTIPTNRQETRYVFLVPVSEVRRAFGSPP